MVDPGSDELDENRELSDSDRELSDSDRELSDSDIDEEKSGAEMPFLDHLEELRWRILKSLGAVLVGAVVAFVFSDPILKLLTIPYEGAVASMFEAREAGPVEAVRGLIEEWLGEPATIIDSAAAGEMPWDQLPPSRQLQSLKPMTYFFVQLQVALLGGFVFALPVLFFQFWQFVAPGLLSREKSLIVPIIGLSLLCFAIGALIAYWIVLPLGLRFFLSLEPPDMTSQWAVNEYIGFVLKLLLGFGIVFEMPVVTLFLSRLGLLTPEYMRSIRRYAVVAIFLLAAIFTPPDPVSQILMALPLLLLYEVSIWVCRASTKKRTELMKKADP